MSLTDWREMIGGRVGGNGHTGRRVIRRTLAIGVLIGLAVPGALTPSGAAPVPDGAVKPPPPTPEELKRSADKLARIVIGFHAYQDSNAHLPNDSYTDGGKRLLSWRVHILPWIDFGKIEAR